jgi:hypothetical protein
MNRKERRRMSKRLGIMEYQRKLPRNKKFELIRENIISGRKLHEEFIRKSQLTQEELAAEAEVQKEYQLAAKIANEEHIPFADAVEKAKRQIYEETKHLEEK